MPDELLVVTDDTLATSRAAVLRAAYEENAGRTDLDPIEEARVVMDIVSTYATDKEAARAEGWSESWISHRKNLLKIHPELREAVRAKARGAEGLAIRDARRLGAVKGIEDMSLAEQRKALTKLLQEDTTKSAARKAATLPVLPRAERKFSAENSDPRSLPEQHPGPATLAQGETGPEFSAEDSGRRSVPEQRPEPAAAAQDELGDEKILVDIRKLPRVPWSDGRRVAELVAEKMHEEQREILLECLFSMIEEERRETVLDRLLNVNPQADS
ncbi:hypothetical protein ACTVZO_43325 [Streptomyces sp. IBSNAI002]|uniref:hypothetical protein n=1 Tax=Streptomyces sp. IBSNAI002 TaxID=3457500 RepID=UPI003FCFCFA3